MTNTNNIAQNQNVQNRTQTKKFFGVFNAVTCLLASINCYRSLARKGFVPKVQLQCKPGMRNHLAESSIFNLFAKDKCLSAFQAISSNENRTCSPCAKTEFIEAGHLTFIQNVMTECCDTSKTEYFEIFPKN